MNRLFFTAALTTLVLTLSPPSHSQIKINDDIISSSVWHLALMPNETIDIDAPYKVFIDDQPVLDNWTAPDKAGSHILTTQNENGQTLQTFTIFILTPSSEISKAGYIGKYRIGHYPKNTPKGFIKLEKEDVSLPLSPHFKVGQFLCKQQPKVWPKYLVVSPSNIERLEALLEDLNEKRDTEADTLFVMSGYRTPFYNSAIGSAKYSRHMYGDAADIYVDTKPRNGVMDDLNRDGKITKADANFLYDYAQNLFTEKKLVEGGLGSYKANAVHGPFVHIDARGRPARWGR